MWISRRQAPSCNVENRSRLVVASHDDRDTDAHSNLISITKWLIKWIKPMQRVITGTNHQRQTRSSGVLFLAISFNRTWVETHQQDNERRRQAVGGPEGVHRYRGLRLLISVLWALSFCRWPRARGAHVGLFLTRSIDNLTYKDVTQVALSRDAIGDPCGLCRGVPFVSR